MQVLFISNIYIAGEIVALSVGGACSFLGIVTTIYLLYLYRKRRKQPQLDSEYAKILPASNAASFSSLYQQTAITPNPHEKHHEPNGGSNAMTPVRYVHAHVEDVLLYRGRTRMVTWGGGREKRRGEW